MKTMLYILVMAGTTYLIRALGYATNAEIVELFGEDEHLKKTLTRTDMEQTVEAGLIDCVGSLSDALRYLHERSGDGAQKTTQNNPCKPVHNPL